jgi:hypothetical protein
VFGGALLGMAVRRLLREQHLSSETKDVVKLGMGTVGTITALVLGLLVASAKGTFDSQTAGLAQLSANAGLLDRSLKHFGPEADPVRQSLRGALNGILETYWPKDGSKSAANSAPTDLGHILDEIQSLNAKSDSQQTSKAIAAKLAQDIGMTRWSMYAQSRNSIPVPFLSVLVFWMAVLFLSFSMFAKPNVVVVTALVVGAASMSAAIFLILELNHPFDGWIRVSPAPLLQTLEHLKP